MYSFKNDYSEGAHPNILHALLETNLVQEEGYGYDRHTHDAIHYIKQKMNRDDVDVHLLSGGTQTNLLAISAFLRPHEAVIAPSTGHIFVNEAGAIENTGHKVITVPAYQGKLNAGQVEAVLKQHSDEHTVKPKLVYISNPTEVGTIYNKKELMELRKVCDDNRLLLYVDGARLASALASEANDLSLFELSSLVDSFYIGGTKNGALLGEALVICNDALKEDFRYHIKQKGALLAKSRVLGIQFSELFRENLYMDLAQHANKMAKMLKNGLMERRVSFLAESPTNQLFPIFSDEEIEELQKDFSFYVWERVDENRSAIRLITSWATLESEVLNFLAAVTKICDSKTAAHHL